jgi:hypothetical protein
LSIQEIRDRLRDIPGAEAMTMQTVMGRQLFGINGKLIGVPVTASDAEIEQTIRAGLASNALAEILPSPSSALLPPLTPPSQPRAPSMSGNFAASIKAMMSEARAGVEQARQEGLSKVTEAVGKLNDAKAATANVAHTMAKTIEDEAASVLAELGQITNDLTGEA